MNLWQKIIEVRKKASGFHKDIDKEGLKYTYVSGNQILSKIKQSMNDNGLILQPSITVGHHETFDYKTQYGKELTDFIVKGEMSYTWINAEKPEEREVISWAYYGQQNEISKALGSALTYSERYFLLKYFGLPTDEDDPDGKMEDQSKPKITDKPKSTGETQKVTTQSLINLAKTKGLTEADILKKHEKEHKKISEVKYIKAEIKEEYYKVLSALPDK